MTEIEVGIIKEFIARRFKHDNAWTEGNCYWAAWIIKERFPCLQIYYISDEGHFVAGDISANVFFDARGLYEKDLTTAPWSIEWIRIFDTSWYERLMKDCRN